MNLIPVIDLMAGKAVHAVRGERDRYLPLATPLCDDADPVTLISGYRKLYPFPIIYVADLDSILGSGDNMNAMRRMTAGYPHIVFWLDAGFNSAGKVSAAVDPDRIRPVIGSECQQSALSCASLLKECRCHQPILSLDYGAGGFMGPRDLLNATSCWPREVIVMTLDRVGVMAGPIPAAARDDGRHYYAAGGVRGPEDIIGLQRAGYRGVLLASALHKQGIAPGELHRLAGSGKRP